MSSNHRQVIFFIDVDDTFVRSAGTKRIPIPATIEHLKKLHCEGANLYCWSSGGSDYARSSAAEFGIEAIFTAFLPKPHVVIDDVDVEQWSNFVQLHPNACHSDRSLSDYADLVQER